MSTPDCRLEDFGNGVFAWVQGDGSWGLSNSGLIEGGDGTVLMVDTLFTPSMTEDMLAAYRRAVPAAATIDVLVNTHANGDHTFGNHLVGGARIIASQACAEEMREFSVENFVGMAARSDNTSAAGRFLHDTMGKFDFTGVVGTLPTETFTTERTLSVGGREVVLKELGPAHTRGDIIVHLPDARTVFTGDLVFAGAHPILWAGPFGNWVDACDHILSLDVDTIVPGHGPTGDKTAVRDIREYLIFVRDEGTACYNAGLTWDEAAWEVGRKGFDSWLDRERVVVNVARLYAELSGGAGPDREEMMEQMLRYRAGASCPHDGPCACHPA